jgi:hypothetical protein
MTPRRWRGRSLGGIAAALLLAALAAGTPGGDPAGPVHAARPLAVLPVDRLRARPAPMDPPESYRWSDRSRFRADLERHVAALHRQAIVLRHGLRSGAGPSPRESLVAIRDAEQGLIVELARMNAATARSWPSVRIDVLDAVLHLGRTIERARRSASPAKPAITI